MRNKVWPTGKGSKLHKPAACALHRSIVEHFLHKGVHVGQWCYAWINPHSRCYMHLAYAKVVVNIKPYACVKKYIPPYGSYHESNHNSCYNGCKALCLNKEGACVISMHKNFVTACRISRICGEGWWMIVVKAAEKDWLMAWTYSHPNGTAIATKLSYNKLQLQVRYMYTSNGNVSRPFQYKRVSV